MWSVEYAKGVEMSSFKRVKFFYLTHKGDEFLCRILVMYNTSTECCDIGCLSDIVKSLNSH